MARGTGWLRRHIPTRENVHEHWLLRPFARHLSDPNLWQFNHRSVTRGVALGLGIGVVIPFMHTALAALLAIPTRANVALAAAFTLAINPLTIPPMYYAAYRIGSWELHHDALVNATDLEHVSGELGRFLFWIHAASGQIALGVLTLAAAAAVLGYLGSSLVWRMWNRGKQRRRGRERIADQD